MKRIVLLAMLALTAVFATACGGENNEPAPLSALMSLAMTTLSTNRPL
ncbi:MAG: hypothetical protein KDE56_04135 [Anaerolineales bacterium]|nr:hypothetical protein [Anaerolineales bacterium]